MKIELCCFCGYWTAYDDSTPSLTTHTASPHSIHRVRFDSFVSKTFTFATIQHQYKDISQWRIFFVVLFLVFLFLMCMYVCVCVFIESFRYRTTPIYKWSVYHIDLNTRIETNKINRVKNFSFCLVQIHTHTIKRMIISPKTNGNSPHRVCLCFERQKRAKEWAEDACAHHT